MIRALLIVEEIQQVMLVDKLAQAFKGIASLHISKVKDQVLSSKQFFSEIWSVYSQLRTEQSEQFAKRELETAESQKDVFIVVTAEGGLSGDIDQKLIEWVLKQYDPVTTDIIVLGQHGALQIAQRNIEIKKYFKLPDSVIKNVDTGPVVLEVEKYRKATVFYQTYVTLTVQDIARIDLLKAVQTLSQQSESASDIISSHNYIFEPSINEVVEYMERTMLGLALTQVILESKLAQFASRFNAMSSAHTKAMDIQHDLERTFHRAKRAESDERLKEIIASRGLSHAG